eukprot:scaffold28635_cov78-Isochrysis_galbana.AAC.1
MLAVLIGARGWARGGHSAGFVLGREAEVHVGARNAGACVCGARSGGVPGQAERRAITGNTATESALA